MKIRILAALALSITLLSCGHAEQHIDSPLKVTEKPLVDTTPNKAHDLIKKFVSQVGDHRALAAKKDVVYTYTYETPSGEKDVSTEKYIFQDELSYGNYHRHDRTFADLEGGIEQGYDGKEYWLKHDGKVMNDAKKIKRVAFSRPTNYYWFTMFQKLEDPGLEYIHIGETPINGVWYDAVRIKFTSTDEKPTDIYQLYINKETGLVDQFLFTVADFGIMDEPLLMKLEYEEVDGLFIPTKRLYKSSTWNADVSDEPWIKVSWTDIKFDNGLSPTDFRK